MIILKQTSDHLLPCLQCFSNSLLHFFYHGLQDLYDLDFADFSDLISYLYGPYPLLLMIIRYNILFIFLLFIHNIPDTWVFLLFFTQAK